MTRIPSGRRANSRRRGTPVGLRPILDAIARTAARLCEANDALISQVEGDLFRRVARFGRMPMPRALGDTFPLNRSSISGRAMLERRTIHVRDLAVAVRREFPRARAAQRLSGARTVLATPLLRNGTAIGAILIRRAKVQPFTQNQIALLKTFADQAVIAIENARLSEQLGARNRELTEALEQQTATGEILGVISSSPTDLQPVLDAVAANAARLCASSDVSLFRLEGDVLKLAAIHGSPPASSPTIGEGLPISRQLVTSRAVLERRTIHVHDLRAVLAEYPEAARYGVPAGIRTMVAVPLIREVAAIGAIVVRRTAVRPFTARQIQLVQTFADQAVIAIENVRLFKELAARNRDLAEALEQQTATGEILAARGESR